MDHFKRARRLLQRDGSFSRGVFSAMCSFHTRLCFSRRFFNLSLESVVNLPSFQLEKKKKVNFEVKMRSWEEDEREK